jgi:hypothetical protein
MIPRVEGSLSGYAERFETDSSDKIAAMVVSPPALSLSFGLAFEDLYSLAGLDRLDAEFTSQLSVADASLAERLSAARANPACLPYKAEAELLIAVAPRTSGRTSSRATIAWRRSSA